MNMRIAQTRIPHRIVSALAALVLGVMTAVAGTSAAMAGQSVVEFVTANPAPDSTISSLPAQYSLTFDQEVTATDSTVQVFDPTGTDINNGTITVSDDGLSLLVDTSSTDRDPGTYTVAYDVQSVAGERVSGTYSFTYVSDAPAPSPTDTAAPSPSESASADATPEPSPSMEARLLVAGNPNASGTPDAIVVIGWSALGLGILAGIAALVFFLVRKNRGAKGDSTSNPPAVK